MRQVIVEKLTRDAFSSFGAFGHLINLPERTYANDCIVKRLTVEESIQINMKKIHH